jgi:hypothetical protein
VSWLLEPPKRKIVVLGCLQLGGQVLLWATHVVQQPWRGLLSFGLFVWTIGMVATARSAQNDDDRVTKLLE